MNTEHLQDRIDELSDELTTLEKEQRRIPELLAEAVESFDRSRIEFLRIRSAEIADELFERRSGIIRKKQELLTVEGEAAGRELAKVKSSVDELNAQIRELEAKRAPFVKEAQRLHETYKGNPHLVRKLGRELDELLWAEKQRLQAEAAAHVAPTVRALNTTNPLLVL